MGLIFRMVAGGYLVYLAYSIYGSSGSVEGAERIAFTASVVLFGIVGAAVVFTSLKALRKGEYEGGEGDLRKAVGEEEKAGESPENQRIKFGEPETIPEREPEEEEPGQGEGNGQQEK